MGSREPNGGLVKTMSKPSRCTLPWTSLGVSVGHSPGGSSELVWKTFDEPSQRHRQKGLTWRQFHKTAARTYRVRWRNEQRRLCSKTFTRMADARAWAVKVEHQLRERSYIDPDLGKVELRDWIGELLDSRIDLRESTRARDHSYVQSLILPTFGDHLLDAVSASDVQAWVVKLSKRKAAATVRKAHELLAKAFDSAVEEGMLPSSPCRRTKLPRVVKTEMRFLSPPRSGASQLPHRPATGPLCSQRRIPVCGSVSSPRCTAIASTSTVDPSPSLRRRSRCTARSSTTNRRLGRDVGPCRCRGSLSRCSESTWWRSPVNACLDHLRVARCGPRTSGIACGGRLSMLRGSRDSASTTCGTLTLLS